MPEDAGSRETEAGRPAGEVYDWLQRGQCLLAGGDAAAAAELLEHAAQAEPESQAIREALARAQFDAGRYPDALASFRWIVEHDPADDYARFGCGLAARRTGALGLAVEQLALAAAMRPDLPHYTQALQSARASQAATS